MPKYKIAGFSILISCFIILIVSSIVMLYPRYQKSMEQLPELITDQDEKLYPALVEIRRQLDSAELSDDEKIIWTGSVCASKYKTLSGSETIYYVCPYLVLKSENLREGDVSDWVIALKFAASAQKRKAITALDTDISITDVIFTARSGENTVILEAATSDGETRDVTDSYLTFSFYDKKLSEDLSGFLSYFSLMPVSNLEDACEESMVFNWSFQIWEDGHQIGIFDDVQVEVPYQILFEEKEKDS